MSYSHHNIIASEIHSSDPLSGGTLSYLEERAKISFYTYIMRKFKEAEKDGLTRAALARRLNKGSDQISHLLSGPGNWRLSTIVELLAGISGDELVPSSRCLRERTPRNRKAIDLLGPQKDNWPKSQPTTEVAWEKVAPNA